MIRKIIWEKWVDPMGVTGEDEFVGEEQYNNEFEKYEKEHEHGTTYKARPAAITSFGIIPINHYNNPDKSFNFWVGHTNFNIGEKTYNIINNTLGVEIFDVFSPLRFRISIGQAFTFREVKDRIEQQLLVTHNKVDLKSLDLEIDPDLQDKIVQKIKSLKQNNKYWLIYVAPNSKFEVSIPGDLKTFNRHKEILSNTREIGGGLLLCSDVFGV